MLKVRQFGVYSLKVVRGLLPLTCSLKNSRVRKGFAVGYFECYETRTPSEYVPIIFPTYRRHMIKSWREREKESEKKMLNGIERHMELPEKAFLNVPRIDFASRIDFSLFVFSIPRVCGSPRNWVRTLRKSTAWLF